MRELGWPVPVFCARTEGGGDVRKNMPSSRSGYIVCFSGFMVEIDFVKY